MSNSVHYSYRHFRLEIRHDGQLKDVNLAMLTECARNKLWEIDDYFLEKAYQLVINQFNQDRYVHKEKLNA